VAAGAIKQNPGNLSMPAVAGVQSATIRRSHPPGQQEKP